MLPLALALALTPLCSAADVPAVSASPVAAPRVRVVRGREGWTLMRDGKPYFVRGGGPQLDHIEEMKRYGGNSVRTWSSDRWKATLDEAARLDMTVLAGYWLKHRDQGFDYSDARQVDAQNRAALADIAKVKDHPALLAWALGNEEEGSGDDPQVWVAVEKLAAAVKALDPDHPIVAVVADFSPEKIRSILRYAPDVDVLGVNSYGGVMSVPERLKSAGWTKPYLMTEYGPPGGEGPRTPWGAMLEPTSTQKAKRYRQAYAAAVDAPGRCLGSYVFKWGSKDEGTQTWHGMLMPGTGEPLGAVDAISEEWTGRRPEHPAPEIRALRFSAAAKAVAPNAALESCLDLAGRAAVTWRLAADVVGSPDLARYKGTCVRLRAPAAAGPYRLYGEARDEHGRGADASAPFLVK